MTRMRVRPLALLRWLISRFVRVDQFCHRCGRRDGLTWWAPNDLWEKVIGQGPGGVRCVACFDRECEGRGIMLRWVPRIEATKGARGQWDVVPPDPELFPVAAEEYRQKQGARC